MKSVATQTPLSVLIIEDVEDDALLAEEALRQGGYMVTAQRVDTAATLDAALASQPWDLLLCDYTMPHFNGLEALAVVRRRGLDTPFILLSGTIGEESAVEAMQAGAHDYIMKDNPARLVPAVRRALRAATERRQRRRAETALRESERFAYATIDALPEHIAILDERGVILAVNAAWRAFGRDNGWLDPQAGVGASYLAAYDVVAQVGDDTACQMVQGIRDVLDLRVPSFVWEYACHAPHEQRWFALQVTRFAGDGPVRVVVTHQNITTRVRAEEALHQSEQRFRALIQNASDLIAVVDQTGLISYLSPSVTAVLGYPPEALLGANWLDLVHPDDVDRMGLSNARVAGTPGRRVIGQGRVRHQDGSWRMLEGGHTNLLDEPGIAGIILNAHDITARAVFEKQLQHQAFHDPLTALPNRALFLDRLEHALAHAARHEGAVGVLVLDLDRFKVINDSLGHAAGDHLLVEVAARLVGCLRQEDTVARMGGDEFAILLGAGRGLLQEERAAERILHALEAPFLLDGHEVVMVTSIGIITSTLHQSAADLLRDVDVALYRAKSKGRGRFEVFDETMNAHALERLELEADLRRGLERGEFVVYYQPQMALATGRLVGMEALLRWVSPTRGLVMPAVFIPLAEETGLIRPLGQWVLEQACRQTRLWHDQAPGEPLVTCVNLSARQFQHPTLVEDVARALQESGVEAHWIELEITESAAMENAETAVVTLRRLKALGVALAIDDFGTGYSSLSYLKRFPIDTLKIDRSFISGMQWQSDDASIVSAVMSLGHALHLTVVAEGVETAEEAAQLRALECELGQGYYFARPLPGEQADGFVTQTPWDTEASGFSMRGAAQAPAGVSCS